MNIFKRWALYVMSWRRHRDIIKELNRLTDRELLDIGLNRGDIDRLVWLDEDKVKRGRLH